MKTDDVVVKKSEVEGCGVFAKRDFKKGEVVMTWDLSNKVSKQEYEKLSDDEKKFVIKYKNTYVKNESPEKYLNHSCDANTIEKNYCDIAIKDIKKGEEVTSDYGEAKDSDPYFMCNCGSKNCKKRIFRYY